MYLCEHPDCDNTHAEPQFTKAVLTLVKGERQPEYFCPTHQSEHPKITFWGEVRQPGKGVYKLGASSKDG